MMKNNGNSSELDNHQDDIEAWLNEDLSHGQIVKRLRKEHRVETSRHSIRRAIKRWDEQAGKRVLDIDDYELGDIERMLRDRNLSPEDWEVTHLKVNEWGEHDENRQLKATLTRKNAVIVPARIDGDYKRPKPKKSKKDGRTVVFVGDPQAPFHDRKLHEAFCSFLAEVQPEEGILIGDTMDLPNISRHPAEPEWAASTQECIDSAYSLLRDYVQSSEKTHWTKLAGNHDERLRRSIIDRLPDLYGLSRANEDRSIFSVNYLLRLDELGIDYIEPAGSYKHAQVNVSDHLAARHGWIARKGSGASALATLDHLGYSIVVGHTHRQSRVHKTSYDIHGNPTTLTAVETGCMCQIKGGLGYAVNADWQQGFAVANVFENGDFTIDLATFVNDTLYWRGRKYE
jgi:hypothetical protein